ncbi:ATP-dependent DNA helicase pcra [Melanogaster broomeanus]|nr:ATP-dependent DNA helicase pcra [Melanogaster broomeanus]
MKHAFLSCLNPAQSQSWLLSGVEHPPAIPLQILAGPGSGKTRVLTSRIAYLILHHGMDPSSICAVTFTNKAANEMRTRLIKILGKNRTDDIKLGTFHAICALFLRKHGHLVGLERNFTICDTDESKKAVTVLLKAHEDILSSNNLTLKEGAVLSMISKAKAKGETPEDVSPLTTKNAVREKKTYKRTVPAPIQQVFADVYKGYEKFLRQSNSLDFDDLLVFGVKLFSEHPHHIKWCSHVLVDEFQDTNIIQYELMCCIASSNKCVTVVGDPDQSIYGWRSAEVRNLARMQNDFANVKQIFLEHNYRSAGSILAASMSIISQEYDEASFIAGEINRLIAQTGGLLGYGDFAVLLRFNALSRTIESALQRERIPNRILGGHKFFERVEIKDLLAYLQLVDNPEFVPAFSRSVNIPSRGIGEKALGEIIARAEQLKSSPFSVVEQICDHKIPDLRLSVKRKMAPFVATIRTLRKLAAGGTSTSTLIRTLLDSIRYEEHLKKTQPDWELRWENVQELINFASEDSGYSGDSVVVNPGIEPSSDTRLRKFLQASMLSSDGDKSSEDGNEKVTITTCHAAKGLEWPVVFIPAVEKGTFPFYRTDDIEEERAQTVLYLTHSLTRRNAGEQGGKDLSDFVSGIRHKNPPLFSDRPPSLSTVDLKVIADILGRDTRPLDKENVNRRTTPQWEGPLAVGSPTLVTSYSQMSAKRHNPLSEDELGQFDPPSSPDLPPYDDTPTDYMPIFQSSRITLPQQQPKLSSFKAGPPSTMSKPRATNPSSEARSAFGTASAVASNPGSTDIPATASKPNAGPLTLSQRQVVTAKGRPQIILNTPPSQPVLETSTLPDPCSDLEIPFPTPPLVGVKRRLGMGRVTTGYSNKKFKTPKT